MGFTQADVMIQNCLALIERAISKGTKSDQHTVLHRFAVVIHSMSEVILQGFLAKPAIKTGVMLTLEVLGK